MHRDSIVTVTGAVVRLALALNIVIGLFVAGALIASWPGHDLIAAQLTGKYRGSVDVDAIVWVLRCLGGLALVGVTLLHRLLTNLRGVLATLRVGDPFAPANARRVQGIAWLLFGWQVLEFALGAINWWVGRLGADNSPWAPSLGGWLSVLVAFVLARVFAAGSRMRDELATTI